MRVSELNALLGARIVNEGWKDVEVCEAYTSDLLSDVMAHAQEDQALVTIQAHKNTVAVASLYGASCIVVCNDRPVPEDMLEAASKEELAVLVTDKNQYQVSGLVFGAFKA